MLFSILLVGSALAFAPSEGPAQRFGSPSQLGLFKQGFRDSGRRRSGNTQDDPLVTNMDSLYTQSDDGVASDMGYVDGARRVGQWNDRPKNDDRWREAPVRDTSVKSSSSYRSGGYSDQAPQGLFDAIPSRQPGGGGFRSTSWNNNMESFGRRSGLVTDSPFGFDDRSGNQSWKRSSNRDDINESRVAPAPYNSYDLPRGPGGPGPRYDEGYGGYDNMRGGIDNGYGYGPEPRDGRGPGPWNRGPRGPPRFSEIKTVAAGALVGMVAISPFTWLHHIVLFESYQGMSQFQWDTVTAALQGGVYASIYRFALGEEFFRNKTPLMRALFWSFLLVRSFVRIDVPMECTTSPYFNCGKPLGFMNWDMLGHLGMNALESWALLAAVAAVMDSLIRSGAIEEFRRYPFR